MKDKAQKLKDRMIDFQSFYQQDLFMEKQMEFYRLAREKSQKEIDIMEGSDRIATMDSPEALGGVFLSESKSLSQGRNPNKNRESLARNSIIEDCKRKKEKAEEKLRSLECEKMENRLEIMNQAYNRRVEVLDLAVDNKFSDVVGIEKPAKAHSQRPTSLSALLLS